MTKLLEEAIQKVKNMPEMEQDNIAAMILDEVKWETAFETTKDKLSILAKKALEDHAKGNSTDLDFGKK
jgi:hypothetical protein